MSDHLSCAYKFVVYAPETHADEIRNVIAVAGGGEIGNYTHCSFSTKGLGRFKPGKGANPHIGEVGEIEAVSEERIEVTLNKDIVGNVIAAVKQAHPYEEVAYDLYPLEVWE